VEDDSLAELERDVPEGLRGRFREIVAVTDAFCGAKLNAEYRQLCREMAAAVCQPGTPAAKGKIEGWAAGIVYAVGWVNFVTDPSQTPHVKAEQIAKGCGASEATMHAKFAVIRDGLDLNRFDPAWTLESKLGQNPLVWMLPTTDGLIIDVRHAPRETQEQAFRLGLIPYVPADRPEAEEEREG
jgi:hypothetical protein